MSGWIKIHRKMMNHWCASDPNFLAVWVRLLFDASYEEKKILFNGTPVLLKRGQLIYGRNAYAKKSGVSVSKLRRVINILTDEHMISQQKTNKYSIISITKYEEYQSVDQQKTSKTPANDQQTTTTKEVKENKEDNIDEKPKPKRKSSLPDNCPTIEDQKLAIKYWEKKNTACNLTFSIDGFRAKMLADGVMAVDWASKWRTWYVNASNWCKQSGSPSGSPYDFGKDDGPLFNQPDKYAGEVPERVEWLLAADQFTETGQIPKRLRDNAEWECPKDIWNKHNGFKIVEAAQ